MFGFLITMCIAIAVEALAPNANPLRKLSAGAALVLAAFLSRNL